MILLYAVYKKTTLNIMNNTDKLKVKGWKKIYHLNTDQKKTGMAILRKIK